MSGNRKLNTHAASKVGVGIIIARGIWIKAGVGVARKKAGVGVARKIVEVGLTRIVKKYM